MERKTGFEPATFSLARRRATTAPLPPAVTLPDWLPGGAEDETRTHTLLSSTAPSTLRVCQFHHLGATDIVSGRSGGTRTPDLRFWRPLLCQTELHSFGATGSISTPRSPGQFLFHPFLTTPPRHSSSPPVPVRGSRSRSPTAGAARDAPAPADHSWSSRTPPAPGHGAPPRPTRPHPRSTRRPDQAVPRGLAPVRQRPREVRDRQVRGPPRQRFQQLAIERPEPDPVHRPTSPNIVQDRFDDSVRLLARSGLDLDREQGRGDDRRQGPRSGLAPARLGRRPALAPSPTPFRSAARIRWSCGPVFGRAAVGGRRPR